MSEQEEWEKISQNIKELANRSAKTKTQIAEETGISKATLSQYFSGRAFPGLITLKKLCKALDCSYEDILD